MADEIPDMETQSDLDILESTDDDTNDDKTEDSDDESDENQDDDSPQDEDGEESTNDESKDEDESDDEEEQKEDEEESEDVDEEEQTNLHQTLKGVDKDIFKKVPELRDIIRRESEFNEVFTSPEEAKFARDVARSYYALEQDVMSGESKGLLESIQKTGKTEFENFAHGLLPTLLETDRGLYIDIVQLPIKQMLQNAFQTGRETKNANLWAAAAHLHRYLYKNDDIDKMPERKGGKKEPSEAEKLLVKERQENFKRALGSFESDVNEVGERTLSKIISQSIAGLEGDDFFKKNITREIKNKINSLMTSDRRYMGSMNSLWRQAASAGFTKDWKQKLVNAYSSRAKALISTARKQVMLEVKGRVKEASRKKLPLRPDSSNSNRGGSDKRSLSAKNVDWNKTSDADFLADRVTYKK